MLASFDPLYPHDDWVDFDLIARVDDLPLPARFLYEQAAPYAVTLLLNPGERNEREWVFARDLLAEGMVWPAGEGDVRISPAEETVQIELCPPGGHVVLVFPRTDLQDALQATEDLVPSGAEGEFFDWAREWELFIRPVDPER